MHIKPLALVALCLFSLPRDSSCAGKAGQIVARKGTYSAQLKFRVRKEELSTLLWGDDFLAEIRIVDSVLLKRGDVTIPIPASAFCDLGNVRKLTILPDPRGCTVKLEGGSDGSGYTCAIKIYGDLVASRRVQSKEFPDEAFEETKYHWVPNDGR